MLLTDMLTLFLASRKRGMDGAKRQATFKTLRFYDQQLTILINYCQERGILTYQALTKYKMLEFFDWVDSKVASKEWSQATKLCILGATRTFLRWVAHDDDCKLADCTPGKERWLPPIPKKPRRLNIPPSADIKKFKNAFNLAHKWRFRDYVITCLLLDTGMRAGEVSNLRLDCTKLDERLLYVTGKTGPRTVPITKEMVRILKGWLKRRQDCTKAAASPYVFPSKYTEQLTPEAIRKSFEKHRKKYGLAKISAHTFRHFYATHYLKAGGDMERLRLNMGHSTYEMLKDYLHVGQVGNQAAQEELEKVSPLGQV